MIKITLPDGNIKEMSDGSSAMDVALSISEGLARRVLAAEVDGEVWDLTRPIPTDSSLIGIFWSCFVWHFSLRLFQLAFDLKTCSKEF